METSSSQGVLHLIPTPLTPYDPKAWDPSLLEDAIPPATLRLLCSLRHFIVESEKTALRLLSRLLPPDALDACTLLPLDEHATAAALEEPLALLRQGTSCGLLSEAGMPCIADPGAALVAAAHALRISVNPCGYESAVLSTLAASGLDGQHFEFLGYLPRHPSELLAAIRHIGTLVLRDGATRLFIETPYRNRRLLDACMQGLPSEVSLAAGYALGTSHQKVIMAPLPAWRDLAGLIANDPCVFAVGLPARLPLHMQSVRDMPVRRASKGAPSGRRSSP